MRGSKSLKQHTTITMVVAMARALSRPSLRRALNLPFRRLLSPSSSSAGILAASPPPAPPSPAARFTAVRCHAESLNSGTSSSISEVKPPTDMVLLFPGCDYEHWLIVMDKPGGEGATKQKMIDCYVQTLAKVVGSEEEAKKKILNISCESFFGFGCEIDEDTSKKLEGLPGVLYVLPDSYVDPEYKDYGGELFVNGEIVQRSPERQKRLEHLLKIRREETERSNKELARRWRIWMRSFWNLRDHIQKFKNKLNNKSET